MNCYLCDNEASQRCPRCGNPFCGDHGEDFCADCLNPVNAAPSGAVFRASLLALLLVSVLALWLLVRPPGLPGDSEGIVIPQASPPPPTPPPPPPSGAVQPPRSPAPSSAPSRPASARGSGCATWGRPPSPTPSCWRSSCGPAPPARTSSRRPHASCRGSTACPGGAP